MIAGPPDTSAQGSPGPTATNRAVIRAACAAFRAAIEETIPRPVGLDAFPKGACGDTCEMLADFLRSRSLGDPTYVTGLSEDHARSHAWLEIDDLIIDITADQFGDVEEQVIVTTDRSWHESRFPSVGRHRPAGLAHWDGLTHAEVEDYYSKLEKTLVFGVPS
ncbi:hypothetical protein LG324_03010 [Phycicoccus jejuensis]|uniref:hypothetical protein n=1 Tax=Phycicoccus jejuensis TaxID=367299 RepID=UPI00384B9239